MTAANDNADNDARMIVQFTAADLRAIVREEVERVLRGQSEPRMKSSRWTDVAGAATHFNCSRKTIYNWIRKGAPAKSFGPDAHPMVRIDLAEFEAWVDHANRGRSTNG